MGWILGLGRYHMPMSQLSPCSTTTEPTGSWACELQLLKPAHPGACALQREATAMRSPGATEDLPLLTTTRERLSTVTKTQASQETTTTKKPSHKKKKKKELAFLMAFVVSLFSRSIMPYSLWPRGLQHSRLPCSLPSPRVCSKFMSIESGMPSSHLILCHRLLLPSIFPTIRVFSNELALHIRWPKYWSFSFNISPSSEYSGLISFRIDCFDLLVSKELSRVFSSTIVWKH